MNTHFDAEDVIAAIDGVLSPSRERHLDACEACRASVADVRQALELARIDRDVPEPSPLFWDHLSDRVREATSTRWQPRRAAWWAEAWKPLVAGGAAAGLLWAAGVWPLSRTPAPAVITESAQPSDAWAEVVARVDQLSPDDLSTVAPLSPGASVLVDELTPAERDAFAMLVEGELNRLQ